MATETIALLVVLAVLATVLTISAIFLVREIRGDRKREDLLKRSVDRQRRGVSDIELARQRQAGASDDDVIVEFDDWTGGDAA